MREIKFRMWDKRDNKMRYEIDSIGFDINDYLPFSVRIPSGSRNSRLVNKTRIEDDGTRTPHGNEEAELMQYTGLKDKNGVEIYEGDIEKDVKGNLSVVVYLEKYGTYAFLPFFEYFNTESPKGVNYASYAYNAMPSIYSEIIGNIYENPELLGGA